MKKYFLLFISAFLLVGCDGSYNLYISDDEIKENIVLHMENSVYDIYPIMDFKQYPISSDTNISYSNSVVDNNGYKDISMNYSFKPEDFSKSSALNSCFSNHKFINDKKYYELDLSGEFKCLYGDSYDINIITDNKVMGHNADSVEANKYTWHVNSRNKDNLSIRIKIKKDKFDTDILFYGLFIVIGIAILIFVKKSIKKKNNKDNF